MKTLICVPVHNRRKITELVLENLMKYKGDQAHLWVYNDWSTEYDNDFLEPLCDRVIKLPPAPELVVVKNESNINGRGVQHLRWHQLREFAAQDQFGFVYFTDSDALHDPDFMQVLFHLYTKYSVNHAKVPVSLYNTRWHADKRKQYREFDDAIARVSIPGISQLYDKEMVCQIVSTLDTYESDPDYDWDFVCLDILRRGTVTSKQSYVEHFGVGEGALHTKGGDWDFDRATNPTPYLAAVRAEVIAYLEGRGPKPAVG